MIRIGVTGLIGSGKSTVMNILGGLGVPLYYTDLRAKEIMEQDLQNEIVDLLGHAAARDGKLDKAYIASRIFSDTEVRQRFENIVHPRVRADMIRWFEAHLSYDFAAVESAILIQSGFSNLMDEVVVVSAPRDVRIERVMLRDGCTLRQVEERMEAQMSQTELMSHASSVIVADEKELLIPQVVEFLSKKKINFAPNAVC